MRVVIGELREVSGFETEAHHIHALYFLHTGPAAVEFAKITFGLFLAAVDVSAYAEFQLEVVGRRVILFHVVYQYARVVDVPLGHFAVPADGIVHRTRNHPVYMQQYIQVFLHHWLPVCDGQYVCRLIHDKYKHKYTKECLNSEGGVWVSGLGNAGFRYP